jgi:hypothetical protein
MAAGESRAWTADVNPRIIALHDLLSSSPMLNLRVFRGTMLSVDAFGVLGIFLVLLPAVFACRNQDSRQQQFARIDRRK